MTFVGQVECWRGGKRQFLAEVCGLAAYPGESFDPRAMPGFTLRNEPHFLPFDKSRALKAI